MRDFINTGILAASFLALFGVAEILYYKFKVKAELTRKLVHMGTGFLTLLFPIMLNNQWLVLFLCATFAVIILASLKFNFLRSINGIDRQSHGSILYPVSVYGCYLAYSFYARLDPTRESYIFFFLPILTLAICDPAAALMGRKFPYGKYRIGKGNKTLVGTASFFVSSLLVTFALYCCVLPGNFNIAIVLPLALLVAVFASATEAVSSKGIDNITIPASVLLVMIAVATIVSLL